MTIEQYIEKLETIVGEAIGYVEGKENQDLMVFIYKLPLGPQVPVLKKFIESLKEHSFKTLEHLNKVAAKL